MTRSAFPSFLRSALAISIAPAPPAKSVRVTETAIAVRKKNAHVSAVLVRAGDVRDSVIAEILDHRGNRKLAAGVISPGRKIRAELNGAISSAAKRIITRLGNLNDISRSLRRG